MKKLVQPTMRFVYLDKPDSKKHLKTVYNRIFEIAQRNIYKRKPNNQHLNEH